MVSDINLAGADLHFEQQMTIVCDEAGRILSARMENGAMGSKVWIVQEGSYSDRHIVGVYSSPEMVRHIIDLDVHLHIDLSVEEWDIDAVNVDHMARGEMLYHVFLQRDGSLRSYGIYGNIEGDEITELHAQPPGSSGGNIVLRVVRWAKSVEHVIKIANEIRTQKIALDEWPE